MIYLYSTRGHKIQRINFVSFFNSGLEEKGELKSWNLRKSIVLLVRNRFHLQLIQILKASVQFYFQYHSSKPNTYNSWECSKILRKMSQEDYIKWLLPFCEPPPLLMSVNPWPIHFSFVKNFFQSMQTNFAINSYTSWKTCFFH